jgi:hypothetical protein
MRVLPSLCATVARKGDTAADVNYGVPLREVYDAWCDQGYCATFELYVLRGIDTEPEPILPNLCHLTIIYDGETNYTDVINSLHRRRENPETVKLQSVHIMYDDTDYNDRE